MQKRILPDRSLKQWEVDLELLRRALPNLPWLASDRLIKRDLEEMQKYLPNWILALGRDNSLVRSSCCKDQIVPMDGALRCILCDSPFSERVDSLLWTGLLPVNLSGRAKALKMIEAARARKKLSYPIVEVGGIKHILVPVEVYYPADWPRSQPLVYYSDRQLLDALGKLPSGHTTHILGKSQLCLYSFKEWNESITIMQIVANRVAPHAFALVKYADEQKTMEYFR